MPYLLVFKCSCVRFPVYIRLLVNTPIHVKYDVVIPGAYCKQDIVSVSFNLYVQWVVCSM